MPCERGGGGMGREYDSCVLPVQAYHKQCYCCASCEKTLLPGEEVGMHNNKFLCKSDLEIIQNEQMDSPTGKQKILGMKLVSICLVLPLDPSPY